MADIKTDSRQAPSGKTGSRQAPSAAYGPKNDSAAVAGAASKGAVTPGAASEYTPEEREEIEAIHADHSFMGHPKGTAALSIAHLCWIFAKYACTSILIYYLYLDVAKGGLGFTETEANQLIAVYTTFFSMCGIVGSIVADKVLGARRALQASRWMEAIAYTFLALPIAGRTPEFAIGAYAIAEVLLCCSAMVGGRSGESMFGKMYEKTDERRDAAFTIMYVFQNIGAMVPFISGIVAEAAGYNAAFSLAAIGSAIGAISLTAADKKFFGPIGKYPDDPMPAPRRRCFVRKLVAVVAALIAMTGVILFVARVPLTDFLTGLSTITLIIPFVYFAYIAASSKTRPEERTRVFGLVPMFIAGVVTFMVWMQNTTIISQYIASTIDRHIFGFELSAPGYQTIPAILAIVFGSLYSALWGKMGKRQPNMPAKMGIGTVLWGLGLLVMVVPFALYPNAPDGSVSSIWPVLFFVLIILGEGCTIPSGFSAATAVAPKAFTTQMVSVWIMSQSAGSSAAALISNFYTPGNEIPYFIAVSGVVIAVGVLLILFSGKLARIMGVVGKND